MTYGTLNHYAYLITGMMKRSQLRNSFDLFTMKDLDLTLFRIRSTDALATLNVKQLQEVIQYIEDSWYLLLLTKKIVTYRDMRKEFIEYFSPIPLDE